MPFGELTLLGNKSTDWIIGRQHRRLSKPFFDIYGSVNAPPVGDEVLMEVASLFLRLMAIITFPEFEAANANNGAVIMNRRALRGMYHWREVHFADFVPPSELEFVRVYRVPRWHTGHLMTEKEIVGIRASPFSWSL